jgi:predicted N-formylglutamate amidohydrolase
MVHFCAMPTAPTRILSAADGPPFILRRAAGAEFLIVCDHASAAIPTELGTLGLTPEILSTHIASDIGARRVAQRVAARLDATLISAGYSRLVVDCNRYPWDPASIAAQSAGITVPGNDGLGRIARAARLAEIFLPYHRAIAAALRELIERGARPVLVSVHSCTPMLDGPPRPWPIGLSHTVPGGFSRRCIGALRGAGLDPVGDNEPYALEPGVDYTVPEHALRAGLEYLQVEFRQDLIGTEARAHAWADRLLDAMVEASAAAASSAPAWIPSWPSPHRAEDAAALLTPPALERPDQNL